MLRMTHPRMESTPAPVDQGAFTRRMTDDSHHTNVTPLRIRAVILIVFQKSDLSSNFSTVAALFEVRMLRKQAGD